MKTNNENSRNDESFDSSALLSDGLMSEEQFIDKWSGDESGEWVESACALFWARSYDMPTTQLVEMAKDYLGIPITNRASCSEYRAKCAVR